jgi:hypothetical protein
MAAERNIEIYKGDSYTHEIRIRNSANVNTNITGRTYTSQMRKSRSSDSIILSFTVVIADAVNGVINMSLTPEATSSIQPGTYFYDFEETNSGYVTTLMTGKVSLVGQVSRG